MFYGGRARLNGRRARLYDRRAWLYDALVLMTTTFCVQRPDAVHSLSSYQIKMQRILSLEYNA
jgi:hypothetical protein